jgi:hypothetical protein
MGIIDKLDRRIGRFAIPNLTILLACAQIIGFAVVLSDEKVLARMVFRAADVAAGEYWRLGTFVFLPVSSNILLFLMGLYFFYLTGSTLEAVWGAFRYNLYLGIAVLATFAVACVFPQVSVTNRFIGESVFLAFAYLYPDFLISLYYIIPIRIKWLAMLAWALNIFIITFVDGPPRWLVLASVSNFLLFFGKDVFRNAVGQRRRTEWHARRLHQPDKPFHCCTICGATERTHRKMDFRYCSKCAGSHEYCEEHLQTHEHVALGATAKQTAERSAEQVNESASR